LLIFHVEDTGCGIKEKDLSKIFEDFRQVDSRRNRSAEGTGLGLAIVKNVVDMHRGKISVKSSIDGTVFEVRLNIVFNQDEEKLELNP